MNISIVIPLFNEEESLPELIKWIDQVMTVHNLSYETVMVDDGSNDQSWAVIEKLKKDYSTVRGIKFRRNYGNK